MPIVPRQTEGQVQVRPDSTPFQSVDAPLSAFGAEQARQLKDAAQSFARAGARFDKINEENNDRELKRLDIEYTRQRRELLMGDGTPQNPGFYSLRGEDALAQADKIQLQLKKIRDDVGATASNPEVTRRFSEMTGIRQENEIAQVQRFVLQERRTAEATLAEARIDEAVQDAVTAGLQDRTTYNQSKAILRGEVIDLGESQGLAPEVIQNRIEEAMTVLHQNMIMAAIKRGDISEANEFFQETKALIDGPIAADLENALNKASDLKFAQESVDNIMGFGLDVTGSLAKAREIEDPEVRKLAVSMVKDRFREIELAKSLARNEASANAFRFISDGNSLNDFQEQFPDQFAILAGDGNIMGMLQRREDAIAEGRIFRRTSDGKTFAAISQLPVEELARLDLSQFTQEFTESEYNSALSIQRGAQERLKNIQGDSSSHRRAEQILAQVGKGIIDFSDKELKGNDKKLAQALLNQMSAFVSDSLQEGKKPTDAELRSKANELYLNVTIPSEGVLSNIMAFFDLDRFRAEAFAAQISELSPEQRAEGRILLDDLNVELETAIREEFEAAGLKATDDDVEQYAFAYIAGDIARVERLLGKGTTDPTTLSPSGKTRSTSRAKETDSAIDQVFDIIDQLSNKAEEGARNLVGDSALNIAGRVGRTVVNKVDREVSEILDAAKPKKKNAKTKVLGDRELEPFDPSVADENTLSFILENEGIRRTKFTGPQGASLIGAGFNLSRSDAENQIKSLGLDFNKVASGEQKLSNQQIGKLLNNTVVEAQQQANSIVSNFSELSQGRRMAITDLVYSLGAGEFVKFKKFITAIQNEDFDKAADEIENSRWFKQVARRGPIVVELIRNG